MSGRQAGTVSAAVLANAAVQTLLLIGDPVPAVDAWFAVALALSITALVVAVAGVTAGVSGTGRGHLRAWPRVGLLGWALVLTVVTAASAVLSPPLALVPLLAAIVLLPAAAVAAGVGAAFRLAARVFRRAPVRAASTLLGAVVLLGLAWLAALLLGFFATGWPASLATWIVFGAVGALLLHLGARLVHRAGALATA